MVCLECQKQGETWIYVRATKEKNLIHRARTHLSRLHGKSFPGQKCNRGAGTGDINEERLIRYFSIDGCNLNDVAEWLCDNEKRLAIEYPKD